MTSTTENQTRSATKSPARIRGALAALAVATAAVTQMMLAAAPDDAAPAYAAGSNCPVWMCGTNHNEEAARDEDR